jgi:hypothetical protein
MDFTDYFYNSPIGLSKVFLLLLMVKGYASMRIFLVDSKEEKELKIGFALDKVDDV